MNCFLAMMLTATAALAAPALAQAPPPVARDMGADRFAAGGFVRVDRPVAGDLIAAGGSVVVDSPVGGDAIVAGGEVRIRGAVSESLFAAGGRVSLEARIGRNVRVAGGQVEFIGPAAIDGNITVGGGQVTIKAPVRGYLQAAGGRVIIDGPVGGDVVSTAGSIELGPNARIDGRLRYASREAPAVDPAARVAGGIERLVLRVHEADESRASAFARGGGWAWSLGLVVLAAVLAGALPGPAERVRRTLGDRAPMSLLVGFVALVCIPVAALILMLTVIGIPAALVVVALYLALLVLGYVATGMALGGLVLRRWWPARCEASGWRIAAAAAGMLVLTLLARVPLAGAFVVLAAVTIGIGTVLIQAASLPGGTRA